MNLGGGYHGLMLQIGKKIIQNDYKIVTIFNSLIN